MFILNFNFRSLARIASLTVLCMFLSIALAKSAQADSKHVMKKLTTTTTTTVDSDNEDQTIPDNMDTPPPMPEAAEPIRDFIINHTFGSKDGSGTADCKTSADSKDVVKDLKAECKEWIKEQKGDLKGKYMSSACEQDCADCGMSLKRCAVNGVIHYRSRSQKD
jgi:hypothetical protein